MGVAGYRRSSVDGNNCAHAEQRWLRRVGRKSTRFEVPSTFVSRRRRIRLGDRKQQFHRLIKRRAVGSRDACIHYSSYDGSARPFCPRFLGRFPRLPGSAAARRTRTTQVSRPRRPVLVDDLHDTFSQDKAERCDALAMK